MTEIKLAYNPGPVNAYGALSPVPAVRLATTIEGGGATGPVAFERHLAPPAVRQAYGESPPERNGTSGLEAGSGAELPALLVSYAYLEPFLKHRHKYAFRDWVMDSGAFSAHASGTPVDLQKYIETCQRLRAEDPQLTEIFGLDVIGDWRASLKNAEAMWAAGVEAIPTFHVGSPEDALLSIARDYPKIALGGAVGYKGKLAWAKQCFARVWPKKIHGFGFGGERDIMALPWHSVDATNWELGPCKFGRWNSLGKLSIRGSKQNLRGEVEHYLKIEKAARFRWRREMETLEAQAAPSVRLALSGTKKSDRDAAFPDVGGPSLRLALGGKGDGVGGERRTSALSPSVSLALANAGGSAESRYSPAFGEKEKE